MSRRTETSVEDREIIVKLALEGKSLREIGKAVGRSRSTIQGIVRKFMDYGITSNKQGRGRKPILDETEKRNIVLEILRDPKQSVPKLTSDISTRIGRSVSCETVRRVVRTVGSQGITDVGDSPGAEKEMNEENPSAVNDEQMEDGAEFPNKKVRRRKKQLYQNIRRQMEFYFSDANVTKDRFLAKLMMEDPNIDISIFLRFNKIRALTTDTRDIASALRGSELLSVTEDGTKVFRTTPVRQKENTDDCTIYVEQLPSDAQHDWLKEVFSAYGNVAYVSVPKFKTSGKIKGFAFVEFETPEEANKTLEAFGAMGCRLSTQMAPEKLCSIQTFEPEEDRSEAIPDEEIRRESTDEDPDASSKKKKKKKKVKLQTSDETNIAESDVAEPEDDSESIHPTKLKKRKKTEENEAEDSNAEPEIVGDDSPPKKKKRKKSDCTEIVEKEEENTEGDAANVQESSVSEGQPERKKRKRKSEDAEDKLNNEESETTEIQISKKKNKKTLETEEVEENKEGITDETEKHSERKKRKRKSEDTEEVDQVIEEDEEQPEGAENEGEVEETGEEEMDEDMVEGEGKKRRKRKKHKKKKPDAEAERLKVLSKKEWKRLRNKYLDLQKVKMKCLKHYMGRNKWNRSTPARSQHSNGNMQEKEETNTESAKQIEADKKPRISFTPDVIVHAVLEQPVMDVRKFKADVKALSEVEYVDVVMGGNEAFIRCANSSAAENLVSNAPWQQTELLKGDDEKTYWDRIFQDRHEKFSQKVRVKQRGREKVLRKVERELGKHIRFDD